MTRVTAVVVAVLSIVSVAAAPAAVGAAPASPSGAGGPAPPAATVPSAGGAAAVDAAGSGAAAPADVDRADGTDAAAGESDDALVTLTIRVRSNTGEALGGVDVNVSHSQGTNETRTFSNGNALVDVPEGSDVTIELSDDTYIVNHPVTVSDVSDGQEVTVTMYPRATAQVVARSADGGTIEDVQVRLRKQGSDQVAAEGRTGEDGLFQSQEVEAGNYRVTAVRRGYRQNVTTFALVNVGRTEIVLEPATVQVSVEVVDDHFTTPEPVQNARVEVVHDGEVVKTGTTSETGEEQLSIQVNAQYTLRATKDGYTVDSETFVLGESGRSESFVINREASLSLEAVNNRVLAGTEALVRVRNAYGEPVEGAEIRRNGSAVGRTDANGELQVPIPDAGNYEIVAAGNGATSGGVIVVGQQAATPTPTTTTATPTPTPTPTPTTTTSSDDSLVGLPGFGPLLALVAVLAALAAIRARRRG